MDRFLFVLVMAMGALNAWPSVGVGQTMVSTIAEKAARVTTRQQQWLEATPNERVRLSELLGEDGARAMAKAKGYEPLYDGFNRSLPQGPDQVYRAEGGRVIVYEAKGGSGQLGHAYGHPQGSTEWAVESANRVLRSTKASKAETAAAKAVLEAAATGKLEVHVIRTNQVLGEPTVAVLEKVATTTDEAGRLANLALGKLVRSTGAIPENAVRSKVEFVDATSKVTDDAARIGRTTKVARTATKALVVVGAAVDVGIRINEGTETERRFVVGEITQEKREIDHAKNAAGLVGGWGGALAGAEGGAIAGATIGGPIGATVGGVAGGIAGYLAGEIAVEAATEWSVNQLHRSGTTIRSSWNYMWSARDR